MKSKAALVALAAIVSVPAMAPEAAFARHRQHHGRVVYRHNCSGGNGAVGTIAGGVGGALIGGAVIGGPLATVAGGVGGALLGRHLDKRHTRARHRC
jgi:uncharacterized protein YcfJ